MAGIAVLEFGRTSGNLLPGSSLGRSALEGPLKPMACRSYRPSDHFGSPEAPVLSPSVYKTLGGYHLITCRGWDVCTDGEGVTMQ